MKIKTNLFRALSGIMMVLLLLPAFTSCNSSDDNKDRDTIFAIFVTLASQNGDQLSFTAQEDSDSDIVTYTTTLKLNPGQVTVGKRYVLLFTNGTTDKPFQSGPVDVINIYNIYNGSIAAKTQQEIDAASTAPFSVTNITRTGKYLNLEINAETDAIPRAFTVYVDQATLTNEYPVVYIALDADVKGLNFSTLFGSFDIAEVWNLRTAKGITVKSVLTPNFSKTFDKESFAPITPNE